MPRSPIRSERRTRRVAPVAAGLAAAMALGAGCVFTPRDAPQPCNPMTDINCRPPAIFEPPLAPENVRDNIERAIETPTVDPNYRDSLNELFQYIPDMGFTGSDHECFDNWNRPIEVEFMRTVLEASLGVRPISVTMTFPLFVDSGELTDPRKRYNVRYEVALTFPDSTRTPPTRTDRYGATAKWDFISPAQTSSWTLERWEDITPTPGTLGSLGILRFGRGPCR